MNFEESNVNFRFGKIVGYTFAYVVATSVLYFSLMLTNRHISVYYIAGTTLCVAATGLVVKRLLK